MPSKSLLHAASFHALGGDYDWDRASERRDYMISREGTEYPSDANHVSGLQGSGADVFRGTGRIAGPGIVSVTHEGTEHRIHATNIVIAVGSHSTVPGIDGLDTITPWTNREATSTREFPDSLVILGAGPTGVEMAQVFARFGVRTTLIASRQRVDPKDHPRNSDFLEEVLRGDGVDVRTRVRAVSVTAAEASADPHVVELSDGSSVRGHALGDEVRPDYRAIPRAVYTDPEVAGVGLTLEEALEAGLDAFEEAAGLAATAKGYAAEAKGHLAIVVDRSSRTLLGAFVAGPAASEVIHEAVLAIKAGTRIDVLAGTIHAFPTTARVLGTLFGQALDRLGPAPRPLATAGADEQAAVASR